MKSDIVMISPFFSPNNGGVETFLDDLILFLNINQQYVSVIAYQPLTTDVNSSIFENVNGNIIYRLPWVKFNLFYKLEKYPFLQLIYLSLGIGLFSLSYFIIGKGRRKKVVHCHGLAAGFVGFLLSFLVRKKFVLNFHTNYRFSKSQIIGRFVRFMIGRYDSVLTLSKACEDNLVEIGVPREKISTYYNWVDEGTFNITDKSEARKEIGWQENEFYAIFVGRFSKEKGIFDLLKAIPLLDQKIKIVIIGGGLGEASVRKISDENPSVTYVGRKNTDELANYFNAADILVYGSIDEDYLGRVSISALHCGLPIMVPDKSYYGGKESKNTIELPSDIGLVFKSNFKSFAKSLNHLYGNKGVAMFDRNSCKEYVRKIYGEEENGKIIMNTLIN
ncbi:MAG: glycosyltransferase family 4 protein [Candidatus Moranbacteria bacterium]|nr:glycosyltransferase family 4 protein [Candidatus Moranbacteria bacterium]